MTTCFTADTHFGHEPIIGPYRQAVRLYPGYGRGHDPRLKRACADREQDLLLRDCAFANPAEHRHRLEGHIALSHGDHAQQRPSEELGAAIRYSLPPSLSAPN